MSKVTFIVEGLDCPDCATSFEKAVQSLSQVEQAQLSFTTSRLVVSSRSAGDFSASVRQVAEGMGYTVVLASDVEMGAIPEVPRWQRFLRGKGYTVSGALFLVLALLSGGNPLLANVLYGMAVLIGGIPVARAGWLALRLGHSLDMNALMTIAAVGAMVVGECAEGAITILLFSVGELLEGYTAGRARRSVRALMELAPDLALLANGERWVSVSTLQVGDRVRVRPGHRIPADGVIVSGSSAIDESPVTGESLPIEKVPRDTVFAGTLNGQGVLTVEVQRVAEDSTVARIKRLIEEAQTQRAPAQRFVDRFARVYTPIVVSLAVLLATVPPLLGLGDLSTWTYRALVMLVISCPCALVISTPVTLVSALARAASAGVLIKGGRHLESLATVRAIAFDKTGTLTVGRPTVLRIGCGRSPEGHDCDHCQALVGKAAAIEAHSEHALGLAVREYALEAGLWKPGLVGEDVTAVTGRGIEGQVAGHRVAVGSHAFYHRSGALDKALCDRIVQAEALGHTVLVVTDECCDESCFLEIADTVRSESAATIRELRASGIERIIMLSGDNEHVAEQIARQVGLDEYRARLLPQDKVAAIDELQRIYGTVAMVGDGVNDAPAMARSSLGIAMGAAGTDVALETADVALMRDDLTQLPFAVKLSKATLRILRANIAFALLIKAVFLLLAALGWANLWMAVLADTGAAVAVSLNGLRLLRFQTRRRQCS